MKTVSPIDKIGFAVFRKGGCVESVLLGDCFMSGISKCNYPDVIYRYLTAELLECEPADLLLLHDLFKREVANETDTSTVGLKTLTKRFFSEICDMLYGILAEQIEKYKKDKDFLPLG